jgi:hypothetical protein
MITPSTSRHALGDAEALLHEELALHDRHAPVALTLEHLAGLIAVAEVAHLPAHVDRVLGLDAVEAGRGRRGQHALPDALDQPLADALLVHGEEQHAHAGAPVRRLVEHALDRRLALAADHRGGEARHRTAGLQRPLGRRCRDDDARAPHRERLGERVDDLRAVQPHPIVLAGSSSHGSVTG